MTGRHRNPFKYHVSTSNIDDNMTIFTQRKRYIASSLVMGLTVCSPAFAACTVPNTLTNGQVADASEVMANFDAIAACAEAAVAPTGSPASGNIAVFSGTKAVTSGNLTGDVTTSGSTATTLANSGVTPGTYTNPNITVDTKGRVTSAENGSGWGSGTSAGTAFPSSPTSGDRFFRTDRGIEYYWNGSYWLSLQILEKSFEITDFSLPLSVTGWARATYPFPGEFNIYVEKLIVSGYLTSTSTSSNYFTVQLLSLDGSTGSNVGGVNSLQGFPQNSWASQSLTIGAAVTSNVDYLQSNIAKFGSGSGYVVSSIIYRLIG